MPKIRNEFNKLFIELGNETIVFERIPIIFLEKQISNVFASKNNKTVGETLSHPRYFPLASLLNDYPDFEKIGIGTFLLHLKKSGDKRYSQFLNSSGDKVFCRFTVPKNNLTLSTGVYCFAIESSIFYFGRTHLPFYTRFHSGYGRVSPKNCFKDGQSTNCHINSLISNLEDSIKLFAHPISGDQIINTLERNLISSFAPPWNRTFF